MRRQIISLGLANFVELALQLLTPIVLVRVLDEEGFGEYRLLWLVAGTLLAALPMGVASSLPYFLPRHDVNGQAIYVRQAFIYMFIVGLGSAFALISPFNSLLPGALATMAQKHFAVPIFLALWLFASILNILPTAEGRAGLQASVVFGIALLRTGATIAGATLGGIDAVVWGLTLVAATKTVLLLALSSVRYGRHLRSGRTYRVLEHAKYAIPIGLNNAVYQLRLQADQWLVVVLFSAIQYGVYSLGAVALALGSVIRTTVTNVIFPEMSKAQAGGDIAKLLEINNHSNVTVSLFVFPMLAYLLAAASPIIRLVYTDAYADAIPIFRLNVIAFLVAVVEITTVMLVLRQGPILLITSIVSLIAGLAASYLGSQWWGLPGAVFGVIVGNFVGVTVVYARASQLLGIPIRTIQDWRTIALIGGAAIASALVAYVPILLISPGRGHIMEIFISGLVFCLAYPLALFGLGEWRLVENVLAALPQRRHLSSRR
jgi:O-antigen/teichoic acid export membrane protein